MRVLLVSVGIKRLFVVSDALDPKTRIISVGRKYLEGHLRILLLSFRLRGLTSPGWLLQIFYFRKILDQLNFTGLLVRCKLCHV